MGDLMLGVSTYGFCFFKLFFSGGKELKQLTEKPAQLLE